VVHTALMVQRRYLNLQTVNRSGYLSSVILAVIDKFVTTHCGLIVYWTVHENMRNPVLWLGRAIRNLLKPAKDRR